MKSLFRHGSLVLLLLMLFGASVHGQQTVSVPEELVAYPDLIVFNGKIVSMDDATLTDSTGTTYQAMAVRGDRIQFLGTDSEVLRYAGPNTRKIDLKGRTVLPGWIDTHNHLHNQAVSQWSRENAAKIERIAKSFTVTGRSFEEITQGIELVIKEQMAHPDPGQWALIILPGGGAGTDIGVEYLAKQGMTREQLDKLAPQLPVFVNAHPQELWNTAARNDFFDFYAVEPTDENEEKILNPQIDRQLISERYFRSHMDELADLLEDHLHHQAAGGFTTYSSHIVGLSFMPAFRQLVEQNRMPMRFAFAHRLCQETNPDPAGCFLRLGDWQGLGDKYYWNVGMTLGGLDSGPPSFCTTMEGPAQYKSQEVCHVHPGNVYYNAIKTALKARYRYVVNHDYGDKEIDSVLDIMDELAKDDPAITVDFLRSLRVSADHCGYYPRKDQLPRLRKYNWMLSCGSQYINRSAPWLEIYGKKYADRIVPVKNILDGGVMPVAELSALDYGEGDGPTAAAYMSWLITRKNARGEFVAPDQAVSRATAMKMMTVWASRYVLKEKEIGTLETGKLADFIVLNKDWFTVPEAEFGTVYPLMTVLGGKVDVLRQEFAKELGTEPVGPQLKFAYKATYDFGRALKPASPDAD